MTLTFSWTAFRLATLWSFVAVMALAPFVAYATTIEFSELYFVLYAFPFAGAMWLHNKFGDEDWQNVGRDHLHLCYLNVVAYLALLVLANPELESVLGGVATIVLLGTCFAFVFAVANCMKHFK